MTTNAKILLAAAALVAAVLLGYTYLVAPNVGGPSEATASDAASLPSASVQATDFDAHEGALTAGRYVTRAVEPLAISFTVPQGWAKQGLPTVVWSDDSNASVGFGIVERMYADPCVAGDEYRDLGPGVDDLIRALETSTAFLDVSPPVDVAVDGRSAKRVQVTDPRPLGVCANDEAALLWELNPFVDNDGDGVPDPMPLQEGMEFTIVDVDGMRLVIGTTYRAAATAHDRAAMALILESIRIDVP